MKKINLTLSQNLTRSNAYFSCDCQICTSQAKNNIQIGPTNDLILISEAQHLGPARSFIWLMRELGKASFVQPLLIQTTDMVVFKNGKPLFLIIHTKEPSVKFSVERIERTEIFKLFSNVARTRKRPDENGAGKDAAMLRYCSKGFSNESIDTSPEHALGPIRILSDKEFFELMYERPGSAVWKNIAYIQTILKTKNGVGDTFFYNYFAPFLRNKRSDYSLHNDVPSMDTPLQYCEFVVQRIACLVYWNSSVEILSLKAEFMVDEEKKIWLVHATHIFAREIQLPKQPNYAKLSKMSKRTLKVFHRDLDMHVATHGKNKLQIKYEDLFRTFYAETKAKIKVDSLLEDVGPQLTPQALELMNRRHRVKKTFQVRPVTRTYKRVNQFRNLSI